MPYIEAKYREKLDEVIVNLQDCILSLPLERQEGGMNYAITKLLSGIGYPSYKMYLRCIGTLEMVKQELYRRIVAPYEDLKKKENGDVF